jgi:hypothetical protein
MLFDTALLRYRTRRFTDDDIARCAGLSVRGWRELIKHKAVNTIEESSGPGRGRVRRCDDVVFKRTALVAALNAAGLSIRVAGMIAFFLPYRTLLYTICDPITILFKNTTQNAPATGLPPRREQPATDWFQRNRPARAEPESDWFIEIFDGRFVGCRYGRCAPNTLAIFGDLRDARTRFVAWHPAHDSSRVIGSQIARLAQQLLPYRDLTKFVAEWEDPDKAVGGLQELGYAYEHHDVGDPLRAAADATARNCSFKTVVNASLALRKALRCYLELGPVRKGEPHVTTSS